MSGRFVRASKYRHVFGRSTKKEQCYDNLRISQNAWDTNLVKANPEYISVNWEASGGGAFAVIPVNEKGKLPDRIPLFRGHTAAVLDTDWSPFDDSFISSGSDDGKILLWKVPQGFTLHQDSDDVKDVTPINKLSGHSRKVGHVLFNPSANSVLASASGDYTVKLWDVETGTPKLTLTHKDVIQSLSWSANGSLLVTTCRDKKLRIWDSRQQKAAVEVAGHSGAKNSRAVWMGEHDRVATTGFSKMSDRQLGLWDIRAAQTPIDGFTTLDQIAGVCMPFWDEGTQMLYLAGKGDGNIRYYEYENDKFEFLSQHTSADPQRGISFLPKRGVNLHENEVTRAYRTVSDSFIEPVSFIVPRRAEVFQSDIYPPTNGLKPSMSSADWFGGKEDLPPKISLESLFEGQTPEEVPSDYKPSGTPIAAPSAPTPTKKEPEAPQPAAAPVSRGLQPSLKDNQSMASIASKFADKDDDEEESSEASSFEEISKPVSRAKTAAAPTRSFEPPASSKPAPHEDSTPAPAARSAASAETLTSGTSTPASTETPAASDPAPAPTTTSTTTQRTTSGGGPAEGLRGALSDIRSLLEAQHQTIQAQNDKLDALTREVMALKSLSKGGSPA